MTTATMTTFAPMTATTFTRKPRYLVTKTTWSLTSDSPCLAQTRAMTLGEMIEAIEWDMTNEADILGVGTLVSDIKSERNDDGSLWCYREHLKINRIDGGMVSGREMSRLMMMAGM